MAMDTSWLEVLNQPEYIWELRNAPATKADLDALEHFFGRPLPQDYRELMFLSNGGALWHLDHWYLRFLHTKDILVYREAYGFDKMPGSLPFGNDGGGECFVFDIRSKHPDGQYPILAVNYVSIGWDETMFIAPNIRSMVQFQHGLLERIAYPDQNK